jgi:Tfp pilus assembly protein PilN
MIHNLLPETEKQILRTIRRMRMLSLALFFGACVGIIGCIALIPAYFSAHDTYQEQDAYHASLAQAPATTTETSSLQKGRELTARLENRTREEAFSTTLAHITNAVPEGIVLETISFDRTNQRVLLEGVARTREDLVAYNKALSETGHFSEIQSPLGTLVKSENIPFQVSFSVIMHHE